MKRFLMMLALALAALHGCGGGSSDLPAPEQQPSVPPEQQPSAPPEQQPSAPPQATPTKAGDFELVAGTLDVAAPAGAPLCQNGPALGADLGSIVTHAVGSNGHIYWLSTDCNPLNSGLNLIEIDPSTGQIRVQSVPYDPKPPEQTLTKVYLPQAIAAASDGSVLIADAEKWAGSFFGNSGIVMNSHPAGIWRFKDGALSKIAGFDRPVPVTTKFDGVNFNNYTYPPSEDGKGGEATFSYDLFKLCTGPSDTFYVYENAGYAQQINGAAYRKVSLDGTVKTISRFTSGGPFMCATNQRVFAGLIQNNVNTNTFVDLVSEQTFGPTLYPLYIGSIYGFGDGLTVSSSDFQAYDGIKLSSLFITDLKHGEIKLDQWINSACGTDSSCSINPDDHFQLDSMPYRMPAWIQFIGIDNNNYAYLRSGNALLRYKLPDSLAGP
jgi:hypothetical protein